MNKNKFKSTALLGASIAGMAGAASTNAHVENSARCDFWQSTALPRTSTGIFRNVYTNEHERNSVRDDFLQSAEPPRTSTSASMAEDAFTNAQGKNANGVNFGVIQDEESGEYILVIPSDLTHGYKELRFGKMDEIPKDVVLGALRANMQAKNSVLKARDESKLRDIYNKTITAIEIRDEIIEHTSKYFYKKMN